MTTGQIKKEVLALTKVWGKSQTGRRRAIPPALVSWDTHPYGHRLQGPVMSITVITVTDKCRGHGQIGVHR